MKKKKAPKPKRAVTPVPERESDGSLIRPADDGLQVQNNTVRYGQEQDADDL